MSKPTATQFFGFYAVLWVALLVWIVVSDDKSSASVIFLKISAVNIALVCINVAGTIMAVATGWAPWRD